MKQKKDWQKRFYAVWLLLFLVLPMNGICAVPNPEELFAKSIYQRSFEKQLISASPEHMEFFITNSTYILDILRTTDFIYFTSVMPRISEYTVTGDPDRIKVTSSLSKLDVNMYNIAPGKFLFVGVGESKIFKLSITGELFAEVEINKILDSEDQCEVNFKIGFKPSSKVMSAMMKPIASLFTDQMNELSDTLLSASKEYVAIIKRVLPVHLTNKNIIPQISFLHRENNNLRKFPIQLEAANQEIKFLKSKLKKGDKGKLSKDNPFKPIVYLIAGFLIGGIFGWLFQKPKSSTNN